MKETIGKRIRGLRIENHMTQTFLAEILHVSQDTISLWELDKSTPSVPDIIKIVKTFKITADYLLGLEE